MYKTKEIYIFSLLKKDLYQTLYLFWGLCDSFKMKKMDKKRKKWKANNDNDDDEGTTQQNCIWFSLKNY